MTSSSTPRYRGIFPVVPTTFADTGELDLASQKRAVDFMIDAGSDGLCILANFSEQFAITDDERDVLTRTILDHVAGRVPVIVTTSHVSARIGAQRNREAQALGAAMVMVMPPSHGATFRVPEAQVRAYFRDVADGLDIPLMIQDAPASGVALSASLLATL
ncbi:dihydrodipicolinate synthase family protein, partial [Bacillus licheniformis]|nr:dihydrodipicolinate synthase family protein [Bacillus licheniformis]